MLGWGWRAGGWGGGSPDSLLPPRRETDQWPQKLIMQLIPQQLLVRPVSGPLQPPRPPATPCSPHPLQ